jgi:hypothetical protein
MDQRQIQGILEIVRILRRNQPIINLLGKLTEGISKIVPCESVRYDLTDAQGRLWSRVVRVGGDPERPEFGDLARLRTYEQREIRQIEQGYEIKLPLGFGELVSGRLIVQRKGPRFTEEEIKLLESCADIFTLGLRARPFEPPPKPRSPFD